MRTSVQPFEEIGAWHPDGLAAGEPLAALATDGKPRVSTGQFDVIDEIRALAVM